MRSHVLHHRDIHTSGGAPCRLEALQLDLKGLGEPGARAVGALLCRAPALRELTLARNPLGGAGVAALGEGLRAATALETLDLQWTSPNFKNVTVAQIYECLDIHKRLNEALRPEILQMFSAIAAMI